VIKERACIGRPPCLDARTPADHFVFVSFVIGHQFIGHQFWPSALSPPITTSTSLRGSRSKQRQQRGNLKSLSQPASLETGGTGDSRTRVEPLPFLVRASPAPLRSVSRESSRQYALNCPKASSHHLTPRTISHARAPQPSHLLPTSEHLDVNLESL